MKHTERTPINDDAENAEIKSAGSVYPFVNLGYEYNVYNV